jgi:hypothetical protein
LHALGSLTDFGFSFRGGEDGRKRGKKRREKASRGVLGRARRNETEKCENYELVWQFSYRKTINSFNQKCSEN